MSIDQSLDSTNIATTMRARMVVRNALNNGWIDINLAEVYVRDADNYSWVRLVPNEFYVRNQRNNGWILIDDKLDLGIDNICAFIGDGLCFGREDDPAAGSGDGEGSGGEEFVLETGYPKGYDLPDCRYAAFYSRVADVYPVGQVIHRPKLRTDETYDPIGLASYAGLGYYARPNVVDASTHSRGAKITETIYRCGTVDGVIEILFASYDQTGISVDVYYMGLRVASTCGLHKGRGKLHFQYTPTENQYEERIMIRVRGQEQSFWSVQVPRIKYPSAAAVAGVYITTLVIRGLDSVVENDSTNYYTQVYYSDGTSKTVVPIWSSGTLPTSTTFNSQGALVVGPLSSDTTAYINATFTENGIKLTADKVVNLLNRDYASLNIQFGIGPLITSDTGYDKAWLDTLTMQVVVLDSDTGTGGEYQIAIPSGLTTVANNQYGYLAIPKLRFGYGYFINTSNGTYGDAGSWDGARAYIDDPDLYTGGFETVIDGNAYVVYRNDYAFEDLNIIFNIKTHASSLISGMP